MLGAIIGDIIGSHFEWNNHKDKHFELFTEECRMTDDSIMTLAVAKWLMETKKTCQMQYSIFQKNKEEIIMKMQFWSKTTTGKWAAGLTMAFIVLMAIKMTAIGATIRLPLPTPVLALLGVIGFIMGLIAIIKYKDRALLTLLSIPVGIIIIAWTLAEIAFPH